MELDLSKPKKPEIPDPLYEPLIPHDDLPQLPATAPNLVKMDSDEGHKEAIAALRVLHMSGVTSGTPPGLSNRINNQKYSILNFIPKVLYEQFRFFFNMFFLFLCLTQFVPVLKVGLMFSYIAPLVFVLALSMMKEAFDDIKRWSRDKDTNDALYPKWDGTAFVPTKSMDLREGNIIELHAGSRVPADCVLLWTSDESHAVFIKTDQLDGETDWKLRNPVISTQRLIERGGPKSMQKSSGYLKSEGASQNLYEYHASWTDETGAGVQPLGLENTLWASTVLCSAHAIAMIVFIGNETRIRMNIKEGKPKTGRLDQELDTMSKWLFGTMMAASVGLFFCAGGNGNIVVESIKYVLLISSVIPISLRVNLDFSKLVFSAKINADKEISAVTRNSQIPEELGRVGYVFSDKTGTLTQNIMQFRRLTSEYMKIIDKDDGYVRNQIRTALVTYNEEMAEAARPAIAGQPQTTIAESRLEGTGGAPSVENPLKLKKKLIPPKGVLGISGGHNNRMQFTVRRMLIDRKAVKPIAVIREILLALNLCHNVTPVVEEGNRTLQASSPDEIALVEASEKFGLALRGRTDKRIELAWTDVNLEQNFEVLVVFPFTSKRKRMGIIIRDERSGRIVFYMKGADDIMMGRVQQSQRGFLKDNTDDLARDGLRTLVYAYRILNADEYENWRSEYDKARREIVKRDELTDAAVELLERDMEVLMVTGVEDRLQEDCDTTIKALKQAGIKFWMLTGDKIETVSCVAISAGLKGPRQEFFVFRDIAKPDELDERLKQFHLSSENRVVVIDSVSLDTALRYNEELFFKAAGRAEAVVCCRLSPSQKARIVKLTKQYTTDITLAIGDGGNDVPMIKKAHVGVGIVGREGKQAALASDFSIGKFSDLKHLVLWHGRNAYKRGALMAQFVVHRGLLVSFMQIYFLIVYDFVQVPIFNGYLMLGYTTLYTMLPIFALIFDEDIDRKNAFQFANLYRDLRRGNELTVKTLLLWLWRSLWQGGIIIMLNVALFEDPFLDFIGVAFTSLVFVQLLNIVSEVTHWNLILLISTAVSLIIYVVSIWLWSGLFGVVQPTLGFYAKSFFTAVICVLPVSLAKRTWRWIDPTDESKISRRIYLQTQGKLVACFKKIFRCWWREEVRSTEFV